MTIQEQYENLEKTVRGYNPAADFQHIRAAFEFAAEAHNCLLYTSDAADD